MEYRGPLNCKNHFISSKYRNTIISQNLVKMSSQYMNIIYITYTVSNFLHLYPPKVSTIDLICCHKPSSKLIIYEFYYLKM